jgi:hypothetical protein
MKKIKDIISLSVFSAAIMLTAWKGTLDWMGMAIIAVILQIPGTRWIKGIFKRKPNVE